MAALACLVAVSRAGQPGAGGSRPLPAWLAMALVAEFGGTLAEDIGANWAARFGSRIDAAGNPLASARHEEFDDILQLLLEHVPGADAHTQGIARWIALSCMGQDHLWEDLGLPERPALTALLGRHFPALAAKNVHNMRWKKFFYKQLCDRAEVHACRAPSCGQCGEYSACFMTPAAQP